MPGFIGQLNSNIGIPLACNHIFFNYTFSHGLFTCCHYNDTFETLDKFLNSSSYSLSPEAAEASKEINFLFFFYLQCSISMYDYSDAAAIQILSRGLIFNGHLKNFTNFIHQADLDSKYHCALQVAYQYLSPPGIGPIFSLEKHSKPINCALFCKNLPYVFTLSNKIHALSLRKIIHMGEIMLPNLKEPDFYKQMIVYLAEDLGDEVKSLRIISGAAIVISDFTLYSVSLDSSLYFTKHFESFKLKSIFQISQKHILVVFDEEKFFEVYNLYTGALEFVQNFDLKIKFIQTAHHSNCVNQEDDFELQRDIFIVLDNPEIHIIRFSTDEDALKIVKKTTLKSPGIDCIGVRFIDSESFSYTRICFSFKDGSIFLLELEKENFNTKILLKPIKDEKDTKNLQLVLMDNKFYKILFLDSNQQLLLMIQKNESFYLFKIPGTYTNGYIVKENLIVGINKGVLDFYKISSIDKNNNLRGLHLMSTDAHFMDITSFFLYKKGKSLINFHYSYNDILILDDLVFTASKDSALKGFHLDSLKVTAKFDIKFHRAVAEIKNLEQINYLYYATYSNDSS